LSLTIGTIRTRYSFRFISRPYRQRAEWTAKR
jgi:hypothetical protein